MSKIIQRGKDIFLITNRLEALTDGVFAIVMTLLVLDISLPEIAGTPVQVDLVQRLLELAPKFFSYALSFAVLGNFWHQHVATLQHVKRLDTGLIWINIALLMFVGLVPFSTSVLSGYQFASTGNIPFVLYVLNILMMVIMRITFLIHASSQAHLVGSDADTSVLRKMRSVQINAALMFVLAIGISFVNIIAAFCVLLLIGVLAFVMPRFIEGFK